MDYCKFLMDQNLITRTRQAFDRALRALPITQHPRIWPIYLTFVKKHDIAETAVRVFRRYLKVIFYPFSNLIIFSPLFVCPVV